MVTKETLFDELPTEVKQRIINIRSLGNMNFGSASLGSVRDVKSVVVPSSAPLCEQVAELYNTARQLEQTNATDSLRKEFHSMVQLAEAYRGAVHEKDFIGEMDRVVSALEARYRKLSKKV